MHSIKRAHTEVARILCGVWTNRHVFPPCLVTDKNCNFNLIRTSSYHIAVILVKSFQYSELEDSGPLTEGLWARASAASAFSYLEKRAFGIANDM
jgi:hypothetical protein